MKKAPEESHANETLKGRGRAIQKHTHHIVLDTKTHPPHSIRYKNHTHYIVLEEFVQ